MKHTLYKWKINNININGMGTMVHAGTVQRHSKVGSRLGRQISNESN